MNMCQDHWDALRAKIEERGLGHLIAPSSEVAAAQMADQLRRGPEDDDTSTPTNFDPLMAAFWSIGSNVMETISRAGGNPLYLLSRGAEDAVEGYGPKYAARTWPRCGLCYLNLAHEVTCTDSRCELDQEHGYDFWLDRAADDAKAKAIELGMVSADG